MAQVSVPVPVPVPVPQVATPAPMAQVAPTPRLASARAARADPSPIDFACDHFFGLGRIESAVPWMNALSLSMSAGFRRFVKSGMPSF